MTAAVVGLLSVLQLIVVILVVMRIMAAVIAMTDHVLSDIYSRGIRRLLDKKCNNVLISM